MDAQIIMIVNMAELIYGYIWQTRQPQLPPTPFATEPVSVRPRHYRRFHVYEHILHPWYNEVLFAASIWDQIAYIEKLQYAFVGSFAARLNADDFPVYELEILVDPSALAD